MEPSNELEKARAAVRALLAVLIARAASELRREGVRAIAAAERCRRWRA